MWYNCITVPKKSKAEGVVVRIYTIMFLTILCAMPLVAQEPPKATGQVFLDVFGGSEGVVVYPQYSWGLEIPTGSLGGYGFVEVAPHEPFFTNHLVVYTPSSAKQFSVHTETGGIPKDGLSFFQVGPRLNLHETIPALKTPLHHFFVAALPHVAGIRPHNLLVAAATNRFKLTSSLEVSIEGYRRIFGDNVPDYGEYWFLLHPEKTRPFSFGVFVLQHGSRTSLSVGIRISS
jgi:hypothetical protein